MRPWSQAVSLGLSILTFLIALLPRSYQGDLGEAGAFRLYTWPKLIRFPWFWLGLGFLAYVLIGALNPAWEYQADAKGWWMHQIDHNPSLPSGVRVPFSLWGPWRMVMIYSSVWLTVSAVWVGLTRRKSFQILFTVLAGNAFLLAVLGITQRALDMTKMFGIWQPPAKYFVSTFVYKNHAGAYFNLLLGLCAGLALWHYDRSERRLDKSSPSGLFAFFGTAVAMIVFFSYSRMATLLMFLLLLVLGVYFVRRHFFGVEPERRSGWVIFMLALVLVAFVRIGIASLQTDRVLERINAVREDHMEVMQNVRVLAWKATSEMVRDHWVTGAGAGSFRFLFPVYQQHYPAILIHDNRRMYWEHAHNDYLEFLAEFGVVGLVFPLLLGLLVVVYLVRTHAWSNALGFCTLLGVGITLIHACVDFHFYNPAIFTTCAVLLFGVIRWVELEEIAIAG